MNTDPTPETLANRKAANELMHEAAAKGDPIDGAYFSLHSLACSTPAEYLVTTGYDYREEDEDDEVRPF